MDVNKLSEQLKAIETNVHNSKIELKGINARLTSSYQYQEDLANTMRAAQNQTNALQEDLHKKSGEISEMYREMKKVMDVFTGNFYED